MRRLSAGEFIPGDVGLSVNLLNDCISRRQDLYARRLISVPRIEQRRLSRSYAGGREPPDGWMDGSDLYPTRAIHVASFSAPPLVRSPGRLFLHPPFIRKYNPVIGSIHFGPARMRSAPRQAELLFPPFFLSLFQSARRLESTTKQRLEGRN